MKIKLVLYLEKYNIWDHCWAESCAIQLHQNEYSSKLKPNCSDTNRKIDCFFPFIYLPIKNQIIINPKSRVFFISESITLPVRRMQFSKWMKCVATNGILIQFFLFLFFIYDKIRRIREITELRPDIRSHLIKELAKCIQYFEFIGLHALVKFRLVLLKFLHKKHSEPFWKRRKNKVQKMLAIFLLFSILWPIWVIS